MKHSKKTVKYYLKHKKSPSNKLQFLYSVEGQLKNHSTNALRKSLKPEDRELLNWIKSEIAHIEANRKKLELEYQRNKPEGFKLSNKQKKLLKELETKVKEGKIKVSESFEIRGEILRMSSGKNEAKKKGKPGRKMDNNAASQDLIESEVKKLIEKGSKYINKEGNPKPTTIRDELILHPEIKLGERALFDRVKKAIKIMQ